MNRNNNRQNGIDDCQCDNSDSRHILSFHCLNKYNKLMHYLHLKTTLYDKNYFNDSGKLSGKQPI